MGQGLSGTKEKLFGSGGEDAGASAAKGYGDGATQASASAGAKSKKSRGDKHAGAASSPVPPAGPQLPADEVLAFYTALKVACGEASFQALLKRAEGQHPKRGVQGHPDQANFTSQLYGLLLHVLRNVLPRKPWCLEPSWEGYRQFLARAATASSDHRVASAKEDVNRILGLPRYTVLRPPAEEPVCMPSMPGSAPSPVVVYDRPLLTDGDGDLAHEFWVEDAAGELRRVLPP
eukprot:TRINITY_DN14351_c1_g5_i2.p1 TRINITY_DN14351_c1_g5~~TRINITY_DN14351_c1_g5_i2.p1  ORF type:complete len:233 (-),score=45.73 TRINITY_DN14351_c1_g5_i2:79-777(-)